MPFLFRKKTKKAQTAIEYLLLFAVVALVVFIGFRTILPKTNTLSQEYFNKVGTGIMGEPPPCFSTILSDIFVNEGNAQQYFTFNSMSGVSGMDDDCEHNNHNQWCHWPGWLMGCYEIADDSGNQDCEDPVAYIRYRWNKTNFPVKRDQINWIIIRVNTNDGSPCEGRFGENDDGWDIGVRTYALNQAGGWTQRNHGGSCNGGGKGTLRISAEFDANGLLDAIVVKARDNHDEGYFQIIDVQIDAHNIEVTCGS